MSVSTSNTTLSVSRGLAGLAGLVLLAACSRGPVDSSQFAVVDFAQAPPAAPCDNYNPLKNAYFGDLHVHTALSNDGYSFGTRSRPDDAYRYAFGAGAVELPADRSGAGGTRSVSIDRPLDFMAVTDHAEFLGEQTLCQDPDSGVAGQRFCNVFEEGQGRNPSLLVKIFSPNPSRDSGLCGEDGERCTEASKIPWQETIDAAERWNDSSSDCERTAFIGYEYSSFRMGSNLHRNVIFRNASVVQRPISYLDATREWWLWDILDRECIRGDEDCDVIAIPHNSNISNGRMFATDYPGADSDADQQARAALRMQLEPIIEVMQHKGDSECRSGVPGVLGDVDELCDFEKFENLAFQAITGQFDVEACASGPLVDRLPRKGPSCIDRNSYARYALISGLQEQERIGVNPFKFGLTASTDTHNATGGMVSEDNFEGHLGWGDSKPENRVRFDNEVPGNASNNPGGLVGVWAPQNRRDDLFDAMRAKEVFGTSGPRIKPRFFGSWSLPGDLCAADNAIEQAYQLAVPMGSDLPARDSEAPVFLAMASADAGSAAEPGLPLQKLQVIKGWYDASGNHHQRIFDVAGGEGEGVGVDLDSCTPQGEGHQQLCTTWQDPEFDQRQRAVYYLRVVENPRCRYTALQCLDLPAERRPEDCRSGVLPSVIQERAWTSPIWYTPS